MDVVEIYRGPDDESLLLLKGRLESQGVECMTRSDLVHSVHPITVNGLGEVRILVAESDAARARELVNDFRNRGTGESAQVL